MDTVEPFSREEFATKDAEGWKPEDVPRLVATVVYVSQQADRVATKERFKDEILRVFLKGKPTLVVGKKALANLTPEDKLMVKDMGRMYMLRVDSAPKIIDIEGKPL